MECALGAGPWLLTAGLGSAPAVDGEQGGLAGAQRLGSPKSGRC